MRPIAGRALSMLMFATSVAGAQSTRAHHDAILEQMHSRWDTPGTLLDAGPVAIEGDYAVADWTQGERGGRALLRLEHGTWTTILCAGDLLRTSDGLQEAGIPAPQARTLAAKLESAERNELPQRLAKMTAFGGIVRMHAESDGHDAHR